MSKLPSPLEELARKLEEAIQQAQRAQLPGTYQSLERIGSMPWTTLPEQQPARE